jgi:hypothetical protein
MWQGRVVLKVKKPHKKPCQRHPGKVAAITKLRGCGEVGKKIKGIWGDSAAK